MGECRVTATSVAETYAPASKTVQVQVSQPLKEPPPPSRFARCDGDTIRVWYFESSAKHHLNISGDQATAIFGGAWWGRIGSISASDCARWPTGRVYGESDARHIAR